MQRTSVVPTTSSGTAGPLGAIHLPRVWEKLTLASAGLLPGGYDECGAGFDQMMLDALHLERGETIAFARSPKPTYVQFEEWVAARNGGHVDKATIRNHNTAIRAYHRSDELAAKMRTASGVRNSAICDAVTLNLLKDLDELHKQVMTR